MTEGDDFDGATVLAHDGSNTMWYARVMLVPERDRGYLFVANAAHNGDDAADDVIAALAAAEPEAEAEAEAEATEQLEGSNGAAVPAN